MGDAFDGYPALAKKPTSQLFFQRLSKCNMEMWGDVFFSSRNLFPKDPDMS